MIIAVASIKWVFVRSASTADFESERYSNAHTSTHMESILMIGKHTCPLGPPVA